ncbi:guanylate kinase [Peptoniphilus stercorisuis]|uniref:Guanylate kinase n=1 Tax=Peptoniphilus stercorisuis TaxID=1436965 RepID=A0ABS4KCE8_9FIRM|nr:AAA family ATPase [Peptoniphilus stercorisuis]MBP2025427.1 guanylate kinase [Peptoniphilus stercorisuis]
MIYLIVGNSGSGKTTQAKLLKENNNLHKIITYTTREIRPDEINNIDYHFIDINTFKELKNQNKLIAITKFANNYYAVPKNELLKYIDSNKSTILIVDLQGVKDLKDEFKAICIYLKLDKINLENRMIKRNEKEHILEDRLREIQDYSKYADYIINANKSEEEINNEILNIIKKTSV